MASIFNPTNWPNVFGPYAIDINDCLGDSVGIINANTNYLASYTAAVSSTASTQINTVDSRVTSLSTTPLARLQDGGQTGSAPLFGIRAWGRFNGSGTLSVTASSSNILSITRTSTGIFEVVFTTAGKPPNANYVIVGSTARDIAAPTNNGNISFSSITDTSFVCRTSYASTTYNSQDVTFLVVW